MVTVSGRGELGPGAWASLHGCGWRCAGRPALRPAHVLWRLMLSMECETMETLSPAVAPCGATTTAPWRRLLPYACCGRVQRRAGTRAMPGTT